MVFSSMTFLCVFFPVVFALYYILPGLRARNVLLILASLLFYAYGEPAYVLLMIFSIVMNYFFGRMMNTRNAGLRKAALLIAVVINIGLLVVFKYTDMILRTINQLAGTQIPMTEIALPIGISFFTFQALSYVIDVYRDEVQSQKSVFNVMLYVSFFPQLIAGPIVKYHDIQKQIETRKTDVQEIAEGFRRFTIGLAKKVLISNTVAIAADGVFNSQIGEINIVAAWIGAISYMLQIIMISADTVIWQSEWGICLDFISRRTSTILIFQQASRSSGEDGIFLFPHGLKNICTSLSGETEKGRSELVSIKWSYSQRQGCGMEQAGLLFCGESGTVCFL